MRDVRMSEERISIVVPVYKVPESYLRKCIESIQCQTYRNIEILLVDDGSPDQCGAICDEYAAGDDRIHVIHKPNGGLSAARNSGQEEACGQWLMFVDGDDWIDPKMCEILLNLAHQNDAQVAFCGMVKEYAASSEPYTYYIPEKVYKGKECLWLQAQLLHFNGNIATAYCKLIDRAFLEKNQIRHDAFLRQGAEGLEFNLRLFDKVGCAVFTAQPLYHYIYNENSISAHHDEKNHDYVLKCFEKIRSFIETSRQRDELLRWFNNRLLYVVITTAISGYFSPANTEPYRDKKRKFKAYLQREIIRTAMKTDNLAGLSMQRRVIILLIRLRQFWLLLLLGKMRYKQKKAR